MNGPISSVKLDQALTWEQFSDLSESLRKQYIQNILNRYDVGPNALARMFGISGPHCGKRLHELGFTFTSRASAADTARFEADYGLAKDCGQDFNRVSVTFSGKFTPEVLARKLAALFESGREAIITIEIMAK